MILAFGRSFLITTYTPHKFACRKQKRNNDEKIFLYAADCHYERHSNCTDRGKRSVA